MTHLRPRLNVHRYVYSCTQKMDQNTYQKVIGCYSPCIKVPYMSLKCSTITTIDYIMLSNAYKYHFLSHFFLQVHNKLWGDYLLKGHQTTRKQDNIVSLIEANSVIHFIKQFFFNTYHQYLFLG